MSHSGNSCCPNPKPVLWTLAIFAAFGFLALIVSGKLASKSPENRAFEGEFSAETIKEQWANLAEVSEAQAALVDETKVDAALKALAQAPAKPAATTLVVPGSPTFLKQAEPAAPAAEPAPAAPADPPAAPAPAAPAPATPAPAPAAPAAPAPAQ